MKRMQTSRRRAVPALACVAALLYGPAAWACPFCDGNEAGINPVRQAIFGDDFGWNAFCTALPFAVFLAIAALLHFGLPARSGASHAGPGAESVDSIGEGRRGGCGPSISRT